LQAAAALTTAGRELGDALPTIDASSAGALLGAALANGVARAGCDAGLANASNAIAVPLLNRKAEPVGAMLLLCDAASNSARLSFVKAFACSAAVSLDGKARITAQKYLFEAFIQLIAAAIDAKSPYTGGHCARVPELTKMLARPACEDVGDAYGKFRLSDDDWQALHIADWRHDGGKVTTPEYVVDKASKLETIYDRIHEMRMRFEVLKRDAEIAACKPKPEARTALCGVANWLPHCDRSTTTLPSSPAVIRAASSWPRKRSRACNASPRAPGHVRWMIELAFPTKNNSARPKLPPPFYRSPKPCSPTNRSTFSLGDRRTDRRPITPWEFAWPTALCSTTSVRSTNLAVERGTLSEEERYKISEHMVQTLVMLAQLPFPTHLSQVPEIAGGHHEKMDGSGYPRRLTGAQVSPLAQMMAIADIFEALTAIDRPYKKGNTFSEAPTIMSRMQAEHHIDAEPFAIFLRSGVFLDYAQRYMQAQQLDEVDIDSLLGSPGNQQLSCKHKA